MDAAYSHLALPVTAFSIWHRDENGATDIRYAEEGDGKDNMATHVVASINICRGMLRQPRVKEAFVELARQYCQVAHGGWMDSQGSSSTTHVQGYANTFIEKILNTFPLVFVEYSLTNPDNMGYQPRRSWRPPFEPRNPSILINGKRAGYMWTAARKAPKQNNVNNDANKTYRTFLFLHANLFLHEISHLFINYLTAGSPGTQLPPPEVNVYTVGTLLDNTKGEAGRIVESLVFGGTMGYWRSDPNDEILVLQESGMPCLHTDVGIYRILPDIIDKTVKGDFEFPYRCSNEVERGPLYSMAPRNAGPSNHSDPLDRHEAAHLAGPWFNDPVGP